MNEHGRNKSMRRYITYYGIVNPMAVMVDLSTVNVEIAELSNSAADNIGSCTDTYSLLLLALITILALIALAIHQFRTIIKMDRLPPKKYDYKAEDVSQLLSVMSEMRRVINCEMCIQHLYDNIVRMLMGSFPCHRASLMLYERESDELVLCSVSGEANKDILDARLKVGTGYAGWVALNRQAVILGGADDENKYAGLNPDDHSTVSAMIVPMIIEDDLVGVIEISMLSGRIIFDNTDLQKLQEIAYTAGMCIQCCRHDGWNNQTIRAEFPDGRSRKKQSGVS